MMKRSYQWAVAGAILSGLLLTGCASVNEAAQSVKEDLQQVTAAAGDSIGNAASGMADRIKRSGKPLELTARHESGSETVLRIEHEVGNIRLVPVAGDAIQVKTTIWFLKDTSYENLAEQAETSFLPEGGNLRLATSPKDDPERNLWDWAESKYGYSDFVIDYEIEVPGSVTGIDIASDVGEVNVEGFKGNYRIRNNVGNIVVLDGHALGASEIEADAGSLQLRMNGIEEGGSLTARTDVGSIRASFADTMKYTLQAESDLGAITGVPDGKREFNGGGAEILLQTSAGEITVE